jgi:hypothetical protein
MAQLTRYVVLGSSSYSSAKPIEMCIGEKMQNRKQLATAKIDYRLNPQDNKLLSPHFLMLIN